MYFNSRGPFHGKVCTSPSLLLISTTPMVEKYVSGAFHDLHNMTLQLEIYLDTAVHVESTILPLLSVFSF